MPTDRPWHPHGCRACRRTSPELVLACLDPDPERRPTAGLLATRLRAAASGPDHGRRAGSPGRRSAAASSSHRSPAGPCATIADPHRAGGPPDHRVRHRTTIRDSPTTACPRSPQPSAGGRSAAPVSPRPAATSPANPPEPASLRRAAVELIALLTEAQLTGEIERKAADRLRKELTELVGSRSKDQEKRLEDLRERLDDEVDRGRLPADFADRVDDVLDRFEETLPQG